MHPEQAIARLLCELTRDLLWPHYAEEVGRCLPGRRLLTRVGHGRATYFKPGKDTLLINYGVKMVASKRCPVAARQWTTMREILRRGYFDGDPGYAGLLAHTVVHEFAHLLQHARGTVAKGSIHNRHFHDYLDEIHAAGLGNRVRHRLQEQARQLNLPLTFTPSPSTATTATDVSGFRKGQQVRFSHRGKIHHGRVLRVNRKTLTVTPLRPEDYPALRWWKVPPHMLES